ncbi:hypothetical protein EDD66_101347 [Mobilisporobacter senegalensis]|uniref:Uncharacterized protein n=1 Tax=Mobilisporobacter senegalensis TaxID=1329262 RepID=A0A3N1XYT2_9FIRM|nr:hypothetical protein [Mobilisporobacter senegalensis]ROR31729.1 hypothetical protein EDD66_101347 [Mobilisporobacter senegalensis]
MNKYSLDKYSNSCFKNVIDNKNKRLISATHIIGFFGESVEDITLFASKICSLDSLVLVVDLSFNKKLFLNVVGDLSSNTVVFRKVCYTCDEEYFNNFKDCFDMVFIFSDFTCISNSIQKVEFAYLSIGVRKYSLLLLEKMLETVNTKIPYGLICRDTEQRAEKQLVKDMLQMLCIKKNKPEHIYYVPHDKRDFDSLIRLEYGVLDISELSQPMSEIISEINEKLTSLSGKSMPYMYQNFNSVVRWMM